MRYLIPSMSVAGVLVAAAVLYAETPPGKSLYRDAVNGFSLTPPVFPKVPEGSTATLAFLMAPPKNNFSSNLNVVIQPASTRKDYREANNKGLASQGWEIVSDKDLQVAGHDAMLIEYKGVMNERNLHWLALAVMDDHRVVLATCTALEEEFQNLEKPFRECLESIQLTK